MRRIRTAIIGTLLLAFAFSPAGGAAILEDYSYEVSADSIILKLQFSEAVSHRVWTTKNPAKVIVDIPEGTISKGLSNVDFDDVALKQIRITSHGDMARVVMDFRYQVPEPIQEWEDEKILTIEVPKSYERGFDVFLTRGVTFSQSRRGTPAGPLLINYLTIDPKRGGTLIPVVAMNEERRRETVSSMVQRVGAVAGVNGSYFAGSGEPLGLIISDGRLLSSPCFNRTAFGVDSSGRLRMEQVGVRGEAKIGDRVFPISGFNRPRLADELIVYTKEYGPSTRTNAYGVELVVQDGVATEIRREDSPIPENGFVLSAHGKLKQVLADVLPGVSVSATWGLDPDWQAQGIVYGVGGGPRLVKDGEVYITGEEERFQDDIIKGRAPRTALGYTADGRILLVAVNGRKENVTIGMTLTELASLMIELGAVDAMNLDGGGSTTMVVRDHVLNLPSDGRERPVSSALLVLGPR